MRIAPLEAGELRLVQVVERPDGNRNYAYVSHRRAMDDEIMGTGEPVRYVALLAHTDAPGKDPIVWHRGTTLEDLYAQLGDAFRYSPPPPGFRAWTAPELGGFAVEDVLR